MQIISEETDMHCYQTIGATTRVSRLIAELKGTEYQQPQSTVADWMESNGIDLEDVLDADYETLKAQVAALLDRELRANLRLVA